MIQWDLVSIRTDQRLVEYFGHAVYPNVQMSFRRKRGQTLLLPQPTTSLRKEHENKSCGLNVLT